MRKIIAASVVGLALVAGQAVASNGAAESLRVGDRVGAALGEREGFQGSWLSGAFAGQSAVNLIFGIVVPSLILTKIVVDDVRLADREDSPS